MAKLFLSIIVYFLALYFKTTDAFVGVAFCYTGTVSTVKNASCIIGLDEFCARIVYVQNGSPGILFTCGSSRSLDCKASSVTFSGVTGTPYCCYESGCNSNTDSTSTGPTSISTGQTSISTSLNSSTSKNVSIKLETRLTFCLYPALMALIIKNK